MSFQIAIDGPAGAGKSTIAKEAALRLGAVYVDTGAMYRTIALALLRQGIDCEDEEVLLHALECINIELKYDKGLQQMYLNGENVTGLIRTEEVSRMASISSAKPIVRQKLLSMQREIASRSDVIMDGRDIGTRILPDAQLKIYLTASTKARAEKRYQEMKEKGISCTLEEIEQDIAERDKRDMERSEAPLKQADDAILVDSSYMSVQQVVDEVVRMAQERKK